MVFVFSLQIFQTPYNSPLSLSLHNSSEVLESLIFFSLWYRQGNWSTDYFKELALSSTIKWGAEGIPEYESSIKTGASSTASSGYLIRSSTGLSGFHWESTEQMTQEPKVFMQRKEDPFSWLGNAEQINMLQAPPKHRRTLGWTNNVLCFFQLSLESRENIPLCLKRGSPVTHLHTVEGSPPDLVWSGWPSLIIQPLLMAVRLGSPWHTAICSK